MEFQFNDQPDPKVVKIWGLKLASVSVKQRDIILSLRSGAREHIMGLLDIALKAHKKK